MRSQTSARWFVRTLPGVVAAGCMFALAHASLISIGKDVAWMRALAFAGTNAVLWFLAAPAAMLLGRSLGGSSGVRAIAWQVALAAVCAPAFGMLQGGAAIAMGLRMAVSPAASAFYYLDLNVAVLVLAAVAIELYGSRLALAMNARRHLALEARLLEVRHDLLTLQLQPHFLFNALNSVVDLVREAPADGARVLRNLRTLFLATTQRSSQAAVTLADELEVVDAFIGVARARHTDTLVVSREISEEALAASIPPLSLQPLVENAIQYALMSDGAARTVALRAVVEAGRLRVSVTNSHGGRDRRTPGLGIGLRNTRERLGHLFGKDFALALDVVADVAVATLDVPFVPMPNDRGENVTTVRLPTGEFAIVTAPGPISTVRRRWLAPIPVIVLIGGFWLLAWMFWALQMHFYRRALGVTGKPIFASGLVDLVSAVSWMALTPIALALGQRFPVNGPRWKRSLLLHVVAALASSAANIAVISAVYGLGELPVNNVLNQAVVNFAIYSLLVAWTHANQVGRWFDERQTATRRLEAELARARWDAMELKLPPESIADELERIAELVMVNATAAEEEVLDMADTLRRMLEGEAVDAERFTADPVARGQSLRL
ncbi:MAG: histidine kinase [bacterium]